MRTFAKVAMAASVVAMIAAAVPAFADNDMNESASSSHAMAEQRKAEREAHLAQLSETARVCVAAAVDKREAAIGAAWSTFSASTTSALSARRTSLAAAWAMTDAKSRNAAIRAAWKAWNTAIRTARKALNANKKAAWATFNTDRKACKPAPGTGVSVHEDSSMDVDL